MSLGRLLRVLYPLIATPILLAGQSPPTLSVADRQRIDAVFKDDNKPHAPGCALGVLRNGHIAYGRGYGWADLEHDVPITTASLFDIGSTSKQFAAASIALLAEEHKLAFTDDVRKYIPELPEYGATITIDHLMRHTSGLRDYNGLLVLAGHAFEEVTTDSQALALIVRQRHLNFPPGSRYEYSNTGFFLLSVIVHRVSGQTLADFARERIFRPLGMTHTLYRNRAAMLIPNGAMGYAPNDSGPDAQGTAPFKNSMSNWEQTGDGAVQLSIDDALRWDENFYHPRVGGQWMVDQLQTRGTLANGDSIKYARGLFVHPYRGLRRIEHGGDWIGYHAAYARFPDQHTSIVVLCNSDGISPEGLSDQVADIVLAKDFPVKTLAATTASHAKKSTGPAATTSRLVGSYFDSTTDEVYGVVDTGGGTPALKFAGRTFPLQATGPSTFSVPGLPVSVTFSVGDTGPARALRLQVASEDRPEATRFDPAKLEADSLRGYAGRYDSPELSVSWSVAVDNDHLVLSGPISVVEIAGSLEPAMTDGFTAPGAFIRFTRDEAGRVTGFELSASRMKGIRFDRSPERRALSQQPADPPTAWKSLIGDYGAPADSNPLTVFERGGQLLETKKGEAPSALTPDSARQISLPRRDYVSATGNFVVHPLRPVDELRRDALRATPPVEAGPFRTPELVDVATLDPAIHLDVRYASANNFLRTPVYTEARAFLQRPAADALIRTLNKLKPLGYGLLIHDAYRPWFVTKIFWDATPPEGKIFVADPSQGSRHNRGCAVDLTLYDLATGKPIEMPGTYDEMSPRSFPTYLGGTSLERWHRDLLRAAMESEGFSVYEAEWWHFDYKDWKQYPILNTPFEKLEHPMTVTRLLTIAAAGLLGACGGYHGGAAGGAPAPAASGISAADLRHRLFIFADDSMLGRGSGTEGNVKGTRYIAAEVARLGLEPAGENGTYFVNVPLRVRRLDSASTLTVGGTPLTPMADYVAVPSFPGFPRMSTTLDASQGLVAVTGGRIADTSVTLSASQIAGKIVVVDLPLTADGRPDPRFWTHGGLDRYQGAAAIAVTALGALPPQALKFFAGERMRLADPATEQGMPTGGPAGLLITQAAAKKMLVAGATVTGKIQFTDRPSASPARDVVAILPGSDPALAGEYVALGGHNDHLGVDHGAAVDLDSLHAFNTAVWQLRGLSPDGPRPTPEQLATIHVNVDSLRRLHPVRRDSVYKGADDDGSGSVSVLEIAQAFARSHTRPKRSILFVWHTGEELGLFGSAYFTDHPTVPRDSIVAQLNMDMVGRGDAGDIKGGGPTYLELVGSRRLSTELGDIVEAVNKTEPMPFTFDYAFDANGHPENIYCRSDHYEYARYGIPIVFFTTGLHQDYHQLSDEPQYIDYEHMARVDQLIYEIALHVADLDHRVVVDKPKPDPHGRCQQ